uniref:NADH-ubiquinone oxidoreductase chain 6 n=1 Tax=Entiminae sp. GENSP01 TaxID=1205552 RepID=A0A0S2MQW1_9CUCU|nr:NADH deshydrogenase subunit 6 [Entiminae sp. GENSP01]
MLLFFLVFSWTLSIIFMFLNHPLSFGFILLLQTIIISASSGILNLDFWFSYILFLIMIGGMLVLFIYMTSVASNEKFKFSKMMMMIMLSGMLLMLISLMTDNFLFMLNSLNYDYTSQNFFNINLSMNKFTNLPMVLVMFMLMIYLLLTLIAIVKITQSKMGPLRSTK